MALLLLSSAVVGAVFDVPRGAGRFEQCFFHQKLQYRRAGVVGAAGDDILLDLCGAETL